MFIKALSLIPLLLIFRPTPNGATTLQCGTKDAADCKLEFVKELDMKFKEHFLDITKNEVKDIMNVFQMALKNLPADDKNAKLLKDSIKILNEDLEKLILNKDNNTILRDIISDIENNFNPHVMHAPGSQKTIPELENVLEKYNYTKIMEKFDFNGFLMAFSKMWSELFVDLRKDDFKAYPEYNAINDIMKKLAGEKDMKKLEKLFREVIIKVREFCKIPSLEELVFYDRKPTAIKQK